MTEHPLNLHPHEVRALLAGRLTQLRRVVKPQPLEAFRGPELYAPYRVDRRGEMRPGAEVFGIYSADGEWGVECPFGRPGDVLWGREKWRLGGAYWDTRLREFNDPEDILFDHVHYAADDIEEHFAGQYRSPVTMPRWASRITLRTTNARVERLQEISEEDAIASGVEYPSLYKCPSCGHVDHDRQDGTGHWEQGTATNEGWPDDTSYSYWFLACNACGVKSNMRLATASEHYAKFWNSIHGKDSWSLNPYVWVGHVELVESQTKGTHEH